VRSVFDCKDSLFQKLTSDITSVLGNLLPIRIFSQSNLTQKSVKDLTTESARFLWFRLLIEVLINMEDSEEARNDLIEICRKQYKDNEVENRKIGDFEKMYTPDRAVSWYTRDSFVYRLLNKALRTENIDIIYKFRSFITDLN
jgi:hypothetical protein